MCSLIKFACSRLLARDHGKPKFHDIFCGDGNAVDFDTWTRYLGTS